MLLRSWWKSFENDKYKKICWIYAHFIARMLSIWGEPSYIILSHCHSFRMLHFMTQKLSLSLFHLWYIITSLLQFIRLYSVNHCKVLVWRVFFSANMSEVTRIWKLYIVQSTDMMWCDVNIWTKVNGTQNLMLEYSPDRKYLKITPSNWVEYPKKMRQLVIQRHESQN